MPSKWTFTIKPIKELLSRYVGDGRGWVDPFAGMNSPAEFTNDHNPAMQAEYHMEAVEFCNQLDGKYKGVLIDPPYSNRQVSEHYKFLGMQATQMDTTTNFRSRVFDAIRSKVDYAITFGWNTNGLGKGRGFECIEILIVNHGGSKNDTLVTVEKRTLNYLF